MKASKALISGTLAVLLLLGCLCGAGGLMFMSILTGSAPAHADCGTAPALELPDTGDSTNFRQWNARQVAHATTIVAAGKHANVPTRGWVIAAATAMQESQLRNYANSRVPRSMRLPHEAVGHDHDSVGLFQQRPSPPDGQGAWGTVHDLMTPAISARKFYTALQRVSGWQQMELTVAAQRVQGSLFPDAYARWEDDAIALVAHVAGIANPDQLGAGPPGAACGNLDDGNYVVSPGGWTQPVIAPIGGRWGEDRGNHRHAGVDLSAPRHMPIRAAAAGTVVTVRCNAPEWHGCDIDGRPGLGGCGWYVDLQHAGNIRTRYCHMVRQPMVNIGDTVTAGQIIGNIGSSGNSSGPHLHYEVHVNIPTSRSASFATSTDPVRFMQQAGAPLGLS